MIQFAFFLLCLIASMCVFAYIMYDGIKTKMYWKIAIAAGGAAIVLAANADAIARYFF